MLLTGLAISVHCVSMCGTLVLTYAIKGDGGGSWAKRMAPHFAYHSAKILSYMLVGLVLGAIGSAFNLGGLRGWVSVFAGVFMILMGLNMTGKFPALRYLTLRPPKFLMTALSKLRKKANADAAEGESTLATPVMFGALTGLMPCGPLQSAQLAAAGAGTALGGAVAMLGFGLGTMPLMLGFGAVSGMMGERFKKLMPVVGAAIIMIVGLVMLNRGAMLVGSPVTFNSVQEYALGSSTPAADGAGVATGKDGVAEVKLSIIDTQFQPQTVSIPADKPVRLVVDRQEENACSAQLAVPQLGILQNLKANGTTTIDIPATKAGTYSLTCGMGMMSGKLQVGGGAAGSGGHLPQLLVLLGAAGAGVWVWRRGKQVPEPAHGKGGAHRRGSPQPAPAGFFGFTPPEVLVIGSAIAVAIIAGLYLGGFFS
jgi:sulfite exporter TauE/SafE